ncbi:MAG: single-stranded-DNA-specific exonuclease RecJ [Pelagibacteraceae bacterium]|jgi:single-stranded-DNA-specific exonuclease
MSLMSVVGKNWIQKEFDLDEIKFIKENFFLDEIVAKLLSIRKIKKEEINFFLNPSIKNSLPNPYSLNDMQKAIDRTISCIVSNEKVGIFGDYDVDGATSTAILGNYFRALNLPYEIYIPDRQKEGFGPNEKGFDYLIENGSKLIFTVDCGTLSYLPIEYANTKKIDVIVIDHHQSEINLPKAHSIVNPNRFDDRSELNYLCAAGVCFMFLVALNKRLRENNWFINKSINEPDLLNFLDLVSLGTICDVVPLVDLNRAFVNQGLKVVNQKKNLGLKTLIEISEIENNLTTYHLGYVLGPRINAGGRVGKSTHGAKLLLNNDSKDAFKISSELNNYNKERQLLEKELLKDIMDKDYGLTDEPVIVLYGENWHEGIIGIIAARIKEKYNKPTFIISTKSGLGKGSARSIYGFDIGTAVIAAVQNKILIRGGGHKMAAGFTLDTDKISEFKNFLIRKFKSININLESKKNIFYDTEISPSAINIDFYDKINVLSPFGSGNPEPKFIIKNVRPVNSKIVGEKHIKSVFEGSDSSTFKTITFNCVDNELGSYLLKKNIKNFNILGKLSLNEWRGQKNVEFIIDDISVIKEQKN